MASSPVQQALSRLVHGRDLVLTSAAAAVPLAVMRAGQAAAQSSGAGELPEAAPGENAFEFVGTAHQVGFDLTLFGYVTRIAGLNPVSLFTGNAAQQRGPAEARLTLYGRARVNARSILPPIFNLNSAGALSFHLSETGGASFENPASFEAGTLVASGTLTIQSVLTMVAPESGVASGFGSLSFTESTPFDLDGETYQLRLDDRALRLVFTGHGALVEPESVMTVAGNGSYAG